METEKTKEPKLVDIAPHTLAMFQRCLSVLKPPPDLTLSEWADRYRVLSAEGSAAPGRWHTSAAPYQREIMDAIGNPHIRKVVIKSAAQIGKTSILMNTLGYYMHHYPAPVMVMEPTLDMAQRLSKDNLAPMIRDTPVLRVLVDTKSRYSGNTILKKNFPGGHVTIVGANSPIGLRMTPFKVLLADEVDGYPESAGTEGDPLFLAEKRQTTFWDKKTVIVSTPTIKGQSRIEAEYNQSTMEEWTVPCPLCGHYQPLSWRCVEFDKEDLSKPIVYRCARCGETAGEYAWKRAGQKGRFEAANPNAQARGFHLNTLASNFCSWLDVAEKFLLADEALKAGDPEKMKTWVNTELGETWEEPGDTVDSDALLARRELYGAEVPDGVLYLTAGVDVQADRLEVEVVGWGLGKENWGIRYQKILGDTTENPVWDRLDAFLQVVFHRRDGTALGISAVCVDSGFHSNEVYRFCLDKFSRNVWAIKGQGGQGVPFTRNPTTNNRVKVPVFPIGVDAGKDVVYQRLRQTERGPNYCHFPLEEEAGYGAEYFKGLASEMKITRFRNGQMKVAWVLRDKNFKRNEPLDLRNYATAAIELFNPTMLVPEQGVKKRVGRRRINGGI